MKKELNVTWNSNLVFESEVDNAKLRLDGEGELVGSVKPKTLMMTALAGCTAMDVISILKKMKIEPEYFNIKVEADLTDDHPKHFTGMHLIYQFKGENIDLSKVEKAITLSLDKYCGVSYSYSKVMDIKWSVELL
jgi:putative redox protein